MLARNLVVVLCAYAVSVSAAWAGPVSLNGAEADTLRQLIGRDQEAATQYKGIVKVANGALKDVPHPVSVIVGEGRLDSDPAKMETEVALKDMPKISALAWAWLVSQDGKYAQKGEDFILAWARENRPDGDPINETTLEPLIVGYDILRNQFAPRDRVTVDNWLRSMAITTWNDSRHLCGNWQSHRLKTVGLVATVLQDNDLWNAVEDGFREQMNTSFQADGKSIDFDLRDAMHYHLFSVQPLLTLACVAHQRNHDWYGYQAKSGASLKLAVDFIKPFALGQETHTEFKHSKAKFDQTRAAAGQHEYTPHVWSTCNAGPVFAEASCVDPEAENLAVKVWCGAPAKKFVNWDSVVNYVREVK
jgi:hypothetical protein